MRVATKSIDTIVERGSSAAGPNREADVTYVLHGARGSGSCAVECVLAEIEADYELRELSLRNDEQRREEYAAVNPHRKVPSLVIDHGPVLTESVAILLTLDDRHPERSLLPAGGTPARAQALRWLFFAATEIYPIVEINDYPERFATDPDQIDATRERAREIWRARWLVVESNVAGDPYLSSDGFSLTDIYLAVVSRWAQQEHWRPAYVPKVERLAAAVAARPAVAPVWARHFGTM